ncbi:MAG: hypothetical protein ACLP9L_25795 [Thermoguttaceae bacterium]
MMTVATAMPPPMSAFDTLLALTTLVTLRTPLTLRTLTGLPGRLTITSLFFGASLVFRAVVTFDWNPVSLPPGTEGGWIALRAY